jgi:dienelactone hydrolase/membrane-associated phospholipid phosphatase
MNHAHAKKSIARILSLFGHPLISLPIISGLTFVTIEGLEYGISTLTIILVLIVLPITAWLTIMFKTGAYTDSDVSDKDQRVHLYLALIPILLLSSLVLYIYNQPNYVYNGMLIVTLLIFSCFLVNYFSKISLHVSLNSYLAVSVFVFSPILSFIWLCVTTLIGWSRIHLNRHHRLEVFLGFTAGIFAGIIFLNIQNKHSHSQTVQFKNDVPTQCEQSTINQESNGLLEVYPKDSFIDEPVHINVSNIEPFQIAGLRVKVTDSSGNEWESFACYQADESGVINPRFQEPLSYSSYTGTHAMGLFWSMQPEQLAAFQYGTNLDFEIYLEIGNTKTANATITRKTYQDLRSLNIFKEEIRDEIIGNFYLKKDGNSNPVIILLGGSGGGFQHNKATFLAAKGYPVLDLKYFADHQLPENLERVPLEYLDKALKLVKQKTETDPSQIVLIGRSKGAEYALIYASKFNNVAAVVSIVGSHVAWSSKSYFRSSWTYNDREIPFVRGSVKEAIKYVRNSRGTGNDQLSYMESAFKKEKRVEKAMIKVENISSPVLLLSGKSDLQWPSAKMSDLIISRANEHNNSDNFQHFSYENAGHEFSETPFIPQPGFSSVVTWKSGGTPQGNALASIEAWNQIFTFLEKFKDVKN